MIICSWKLIFCPCLDIFEQPFKEGKFWGFPVKVVSINPAIFNATHPGLLVDWHALLLLHMHTSTEEWPWYMHPIQPNLASSTGHERGPQFPRLCKDSRILRQAGVREALSSLCLNPSLLLQACVSAPGYQESCMVKIWPADPSPWSSSPPKFVC